MKRLRRLLAKAISGAKRTLPTGHLSDDLLNYIHGWARLGYVPHVSSPRSFNEHVLSNKWRFRGDIELARRLTDKYFFKDWLREKGFLLIHEAQQGCRDATYEPSRFPVAVPYPSPHRATPAYVVVTSSDLDTSRNKASVSGLSWISRKGFYDLVVPTVGLYNSVEEVRDVIFEENTILKPTHLSGCAIPIYESRTLNIDELSILRNWIRTDYYRRSREKTYKGVQKRFICERLMLDSRNEIPMDYKFFMCLGQPLMVQVNIDRFANHTEQLYSTDWELLEARLKFPRNPVPIDRPATLDTALELASALSHDFPICRVDLYLLPDDVIKAGEITFFPGGGGSKFTPKSADFSLGERMKRILDKSPD